MVVMVVSLRLRPRPRVLMSGDGYPRKGDDHASVCAQARGLSGGQPVLYGRDGGGVALYQPPAKGIQVPKSGEGVLGLDGFVLASF